jgi:hypothetical protein
MPVRSGCPTPANLSPKPRDCGAFPWGRNDGKNNGAKKGLDLLAQFFLMAEFIGDVRKPSKNASCGMRINVAFRDLE